MIHDTDEGVRLLLAEEGVPGAGVELAFDPPTTDWAAKRNSPTVSVFLYDIREDAALRSTGAVEQRDEVLRVVGERLGRTAPDEALVGRRGGDAFVVLGDRQQARRELLAEHAGGLLAFRRADP